MKRAALGVILGLLIHVPAAAALTAQRPPLPDVRSRFLPDAIRVLEEAGFGNIRVARQIMDDMPRDVVIWQYPLPPAPTVAANARPVDPRTEITLIVVEGLPMVPDLTGWRADQAVEHVAALGVEARIQDLAADPARSVVVGQEPPGPFRALPPASVELQVGPMPRDSVVLTTLDTVTVSSVDTIRSAAGGENGRVPLYVVGLASLGGLALGGLAVRGLSGLGPPRPPAPTAAQPSHPDPDPVGRDREGLDLEAIEPLLVDEAIRVTAGRAEVAAMVGGRGEERGS
jgi:hypothetical protein